MTARPEGDAPGAAARVDPASLVLRGPARRVVRFRRGLLITIAAFGAAAIMAAAWLGLQPAGLRLVAEGDELYERDRRGAPEALSHLPGSYGELGVPRLGPPLPGDLGRPILERRRQLEGSGPPAGSGSGEDRAAAEWSRREAEERSARASDVMVQLANGARPGAPAPVAVDTPAAARPAGSPDAADDGSSAGDLQQPPGRWFLSAGTVIPASLITGLNSDLPGTVLAQVTENVRDSLAGRVILIPQGARLLGSYGSEVAFGQRRAMLVWRRIVFPDGSSLALDDLPATDPSGFAGVEDEVDLHEGRLVRGIAMATLLGVGTELSLGASEGELVRALRESAQTSAARAGDRITARNLDIRPTITVRPGWPLRAIVSRDLVLRPWRG